MYILTVNYSPDRTDEVVAMLEAEPRVSNVLVVQEVATKEGIDMPYPTYVLDSVVVHAEDGPVLPNPASSQGSDTDE